ncbi:MAG: ABC transporter permease [Bacteriovoracaceae bacterium]
MIKVKNIINIFKKEFIETFRDKAFIYTNFIGPLIFFPILLILIGEIASLKVDKLKKETYKIGIVNNQKEFNLSELLLDHKKIKDKVQILTSTSLKDFIEKKEINFDQKVLGQEQRKSIKDYIKKEKLDLILYLPKPKKTNDQVILYSFYDFTNSKSTRIHKAANKIVETQAKQILEKTLKQYSLTKESLNPFIIEELNLRSKDQTWGHSLGVIISFFIIFLLITAIHNPAINSTIGERDRKTLNFLLMSPLSTREILLGKYLNIACQGLLALIPYAFQMVIAYFSFSELNIFTQLQALNEPKSLLFILLLVFSTSLFLSSLSFLLTCLAKTMAQAQTMLSFIIFMVFLPMGIIKGLSLSAVSPYQFFPLINFSLSLQDILMGSGHTNFYILSIAANLVISFSFIVYADYFFKAQNILSKGDAGFSEMMSLKKTKITESNPTISFLLAIFIPFLIVNSKSLNFIKEQTLYLILFHTIFANVISSIMLLRFYKLDIKKSIGLSSSSTKYYLSSILIVLGLTPLLSIMLPHSEEQTGLIKLLTSVNLTDKNYPVWLQILFLSILPSIAEGVSYRGVILRGLKKKFPLFVTCFTASLFYVLSNFSLTTTFPLLVLGFFLSFIALKADSVYPSIFAQILFSSTAILTSKVPFLNVNLYAFEEKIFLAIIGLIILASGIILLNDKQEGSNENKESFSNKNAA